MGTRVFFLAVALGLVGTAVWAYHHDEELRKNSMQVSLGDPNEVVRDLLGDPGREEPCGTLTAVPTGCANEYVYRYYYSIFNPQYEVVWFDHAGKVLGLQHVKAP